VRSRFSIRDRLIELFSLGVTAKKLSEYRLEVCVFTALHEMQTRSSGENSVRPSVCMSVTRVYCDKTVERSVQIFIPYERTFSLVF